MKECSEPHRFIYIHHAAPSKITCILGALCLTSAFDCIAAEPRWLDYNRPVKLSGIIVKEFDMSFVNSDISPVTDPKEAEKLAKQERKKGPPLGAFPKEPVLHWILRLDSPISMRDGHNDSYPEERNISEIDMGGPGINEGIHIGRRAYGTTHFLVSGKLWHACTIHHLRQAMLELSRIKPMISVSQ